MRWLLILLLATIALPAAAANPSKFEGNYTVDLALKPGLDGPKCSSYDIRSVHVEKGQLQPGSGAAQLTGTISDAGVLDGQLRKSDGADVPFQGQLEASEYDPTRVHIIATIIDSKSNCGWTLTLTHD